MMNKIFLSVIVLFCLNSLMSAQINISGASTIGPYTQKLAELYQKKTGFRIKVEMGGSGIGISNTKNKISDIGMVSRELHENEKRFLEHRLIGYDALAIVVHQSNPLSEISKSQLIDLYTGKLREWQAINGKKIKVVCVSKEKGRSTLELFEKYSGLKGYSDQTGDDKSISKNTVIIGSNLEAITITGGLPGAICYVSYGSSLQLIEKGMPVKIIKLDGVELNRESIINRKYPIIRELNFVYRDQANKTVMNFMEYSLSSEGQSLLEEFGFIRSQ